MISRVDSQASNPLRPVDWRYQAAAERVASGRPLPRQTWDGHTYRTAAYLRRLELRTDPRRLATEFPALHTAMGIYQDADPQLRYALEAQLLTGAATAEIAEWLGTSEEAIDAYAAVFFDVHDRLEHVDFILQEVINPKADESFDDRDSGWKLLAYVGGAEASSIFTGPQRGLGFAGVVESYRHATTLALGNRMRRLVESGAELDPRLLRDWAKILGYFAKNKAKNLPPIDPSENIKRMFKGLPVEFVPDPTSETGYRMRLTDGCP